MIKSKAQEALDRLFQQYYCGGLFRFDGQPIPYSEEQELKDWETFREELKRLKELEDKQESEDREEYLIR